MIIGPALWMFGVWTACLLQDGETARAAAPQWEPRLLARPQEIESDPAREAVNAFKKSIRSKEVADRLAALDALLAAGRHESMMKPVSGLLKDRDPKVREAAARALGAIGDPDAVRPLLAAFRHPLNEEAPAVREEAATALGRVSDRSLVSVVEKDFRSGDQYTKRGLIVAFGVGRDYRAALLLAENIARPQPGSVNSARNPPASYWQEKFKEWQYISPAVGWSLHQITGETFESAEQVEAWVHRKGWLERDEEGGDEDGR